MNTRTRNIAVAAFAVLGIVAFGAGGAGSTRFAGDLASADSERPDCPGKIICPLTGQPVCVDKCPVKDPLREDCPGRIVCPLTGELVCKDRCPLGDGTKASAKTRSKPSCCDKQGPEHGSAN